MNELDQIKELHEMLNIGLGFEKDLKKVGITTPEELRKVGSKEAFLRLKRGGVQNLNLNKLAALSWRPWRVRYEMLKSTLWTKRPERIWKTFT